MQGTETLVCSKRHESQQLKVGTSFIDKHPQLVQKSINSKAKSFIAIGKKDY